MFRKQRILTTLAMSILGLCPETSCCLTFMRHLPYRVVSKNTPCSGFAKGLWFLNMVITFTLTPLSHYNSITEPRAYFLLSLLEDLFIDFLSYFITFVLNVYQDTMTRDQLIFPSATTQIVCHFYILIPDSLYFTTMGAINAGSVRQSEAQLRPKWPRVKMTDPATFAVPSSSAPSTSAASGMTLKTIMAQLQRMDARLDSLTDEMCQVNTCVGHITRRQARLGGFAPSPSPSPEALADEDDDADDDEDDDTSSSNDDEMTISL